MNDEKLAFTVVEFRTFVTLAAPGERCVYYSGVSFARKEFTSVFNEARKAYKDSLVHLVQRKISDGYYDYIAERASPRELRHGIQHRSP